MDLPSNVCIACSCRSTHPFQVFLVSNIDQPWMGSTRHVPVPEPLYRIPLSHPRTGIKMSIALFEVSCLRLPTHTYHGYGLSAEPRGD